MKPILERVIAGATAGTIATCTMSPAMAVARAAGLLGEPPPRKLTRRFLGTFGVNRSRPRLLSVVTAVSHVGYGAAVGMIYGLLPRRLSSAPLGAAFGLAVWASSYAGWIPKLGLMPPPSFDRPGRPTAMIVAHLVYGATLGRVRKSLSWGERGESSMQGKVAVVCGGSRGLGRAVALELARRGASVATCARSAGDLARIRSELFAEGVPAVAEICDLRNEGETREFLDLVTTTLGAIDILVTNAATINVGPVETQTTSDFHDALTSTFDTALNPTLAVLPSMQRRRRGTIAFVTSIGGKIGVPHLAPYSAAKFATVGFANALRAEIAKDGVHVLTIVPGLMRTGSHLRATFQGDPEKELAWFGASATTPGISIDADVAARRIVRAILRGDDEIVFTLPARIASRTHDLLPALWSFAMSIVGRLLPRPAMGAAILREEGRTVADRPSSKLVGLVRARGRKLAVRHNELAPRA